MGRAVNLSPLGLYNWDNTIFDLMQIPEALDKDTLVQNLLAETAELEVLYPNPVVFKNLLGVWSAKQIDIWNRLYATTQYEYNPIENYNRYEEGSDSGTGTTRHSGTDTTTETTTHGGTDGRTEAITTGGKDTLNMSRQDGGTETEAGTGSVEYGGKDTLDMTRRDGGTESRSGTVNMKQGGTENEENTTQINTSGSDTVTGTQTAGHWIAGYDAPTPTEQNDGLFKQTRDQTDNETVTTYGKQESGSGDKTTTFGKTEDTTSAETITFGKTETNKDETTYGKTEDSTNSKTTTFGKTETNKDETTYGKTENVQETRTYGETVGKTGGVTHGEQVATTNEGEHTLHAHGNIGVTTTQKMIKEQRQVDLFNVYDIIIEDFKMRFCILVY